MESFLKAVKWQIGIRLVPGDVLVSWVGGAKFITGRGDNGITGNIYAGLHDFDDMGYLLHGVTTTDLFIDVGANVGAYTLLACGAKGARGYCFEPVSSTFERLLRNLAVNNLTTRVIPMNIGISDREGTLSFTADNNCGNYVIPNDDSHHDSIGVPVRSLDSLLSNESPSIIKIDVEGFESKVLDGAKEVLNKGSLKTVIMEVNGPGGRYSFDPKVVLATMKKYDFRIYSYDPFTRILSLQDQPNAHGNNTLFLRDEAAIQARLLNAPVVQVGSQAI